jgi:hypothetical protein
MKKIVFEKAPAELKFVGVQSENGWKAIVVKDHKKDNFRVINLAENENYPAWLEKTIDKIIYESKKIPTTTPYSFTSNTDLVNWAMGDDSVQKSPITNTIHINDVTDEMFVGIVWSDNSKNFCLNTKKGFISKYPASLNSSSEVIDKTMKEYISNRKKNDLKSAYVFPTAKELLQWVIED